MELFRYMVLRPPEAVSGLVMLAPPDDLGAQEPSGAAARGSITSRLRYGDSVGGLLALLPEESAAVTSDTATRALGAPPAELAQSDDFRVDVAELDAGIAAIVATGADPAGDGTELCRLRRGYDLVVQLGDGAESAGLRSLALPAPAGSAPASRDGDQAEAAPPPRPGIYRVGSRLIEVTDDVPERSGPADARPAAADVPPKLRPAGVGDLIVVREHVLRYEGGALAHIQNVLKSESLERETRRLDRTEITVSEETETTQETTQDTQTTERFSLDRETSTTVKEDSELKTGLSVTGRYGPMVEVKADVSYAVSNSAESAAKQAATFGKDVTQRSVNKLTERVKRVRSQTTLSEFEEYHKHGFDNSHGIRNISGVYQWVDKVSRAQMFNYGKRLLFDLVVPEPAAFLIATAGSAAGTEATVPRPEPLTETVNDITEQNYARVASRYRVTGLEAPPWPQVVVSKAFKGETTDQPGAKSDSAELVIPQGYEARKATWGSVHQPLPPPGGSVFGELRVVVGDTHLPASSPSATDLKTPAAGSISVAVGANEIRTFAVNVEVVCSRTDEALTKWKIKVYDAIVTAYSKLKADYDRALAEAEVADTNPVQGRNPLENHRMEIDELKKFCLSLIAGQQFDGYGAIELDPGTGLPQVNVQAATAQGPVIRFFEQAFEWEQIQYVLYPYFWGKKSGWQARVLSSDPDSNFAEFVRAGAARVVVPVRPGFTDYVLYFLQWGKVWNDGPVPPVNDPAYVPIAKEIRASEQQPGAEVMVPGGTWDVVVPTTLVRLRESDALPEWQQLPDGSWRERPSGPSVSAHDNAPAEDTVAAQETVPAGETE